MASQDLIKYIKDSKRLGFSDKDIYYRLKSAGYSDSDIVAGFRNSKQINNARLVLILVVFAIILILALAAVYLFFIPGQTKVLFYVSPLYECTPENGINGPDAYVICEETHKFPVTGIKSCASLTQDAKIACETLVANKPEKCQTTRASERCRLLHAIHNKDVEACSTFGQESGQDLSALCKSMIKSPQPYLSVFNTRFYLYN